MQPGTALRIGVAVVAVAAAAFVFVKLRSPPLPTPYAAIPLPALPPGSSNTTTLKIPASAVLSTNAPAPSFITSPGILTNPPITTVVETSDFRPVEWVTNAVEDTGQVISLTNRYTEVATGLLYREDNGPWLETVPEFQPVTGGYMAVRGPHQAAVSSQVATRGFATVLTSDGQTIRSTPMLLAFHDRSSGVGATIARLQPSVGIQTATNRILYTNAFDSQFADIQAEYTRAGVALDVILRTQMPDPALFGLNPETTDLAFYTEIFGIKPTSTNGFEVPIGTNELAPDSSVLFGRMGIDRSRIYALGTTSGADPRELSVRTVVEERDGRLLIIERVAYREARFLLSPLPAANQPSAADRAATNTVLPLPPTIASVAEWPRTPGGRFLQVTSGPVVLQPAPVAYGVVFDPSIQGSTLNPVLDGSTTYHVVADLLPSGAATFQAGTVLKYNPGVRVRPNNATRVQCGGEPYRPVILTSPDDNSVGESVVISTTTPPNGFWASRALDLTGAGLTSPLTLTNLLVRNATVGVSAEAFSPTISLKIRHGQFANCDAGLRFQHAQTGANSYFLQNVLVTRDPPAATSCAMADVLGAQVTAEHLTVRQVGTLFRRNAADSASVLNYSRSVVFQVNDTSSSVPNLSPPFPGVGSPFRLPTLGGSGFLNLDDAGVETWSRIAPGTPSVADAEFAAELRQTTALAPAQLPQVIATTTVLEPVVDAWGVPGSERLGYHYWPIHYVTFGPSQVTGATLLLTNGVVVCVPSNDGFKLGSGGRLIARGRPDAMARICWPSAVTEMPVQRPPSRRIASVLPSAISGFPELDFQFLRVGFASDPDTTRRLYWEPGYGRSSSVWFRDCQFSGANFGFSPIGSTPTQFLSFSNTLFENCNLTFPSTGGDARSVTARFNLFRNGTTWWAPPVSAATAWILSGNHFDNHTFANVPAWTQAPSHNGYSQSAAALGGTANVMNVPSAFAAGALGRFYHSAAQSMLDNAGPQPAPAAGLYHYTTRPDQTKEAGSIVDIGFHYPASAGTGMAGTDRKPQDFDRDGLADIDEDVNGDGQKAPLESDWTNADTDRDGNVDGEEVDGYTNPQDRNQWIPKRLASWTWDGAGGAFTRDGRNDAGPVAPLVTTQGAPAIGLNGIGNGIGFDGGPGTLQYPAVEERGRINLTRDRGTIRLWFKPNWSSTSWPTAGSNLRLVETGSFNQPGWWSWMLEHTSGIPLILKLGQSGPDPSSPGTVALDFRFGIPFEGANTGTPFCPVLHLGSWGQSAWHRFQLCYDDHNTRAYHQEAILRSGSTATGQPVITEPNWMPASPGPFALGTQVSSASNSLDGTLDDVETFNYSQGEPELYQNQQFSIDIVTNVPGARSLRFSRPFDPTPSPVQRPSAPWGVTISRRPAGTQGWTTLIANSTAPEFIDSGINPGQEYEYRAEIISGSCFKSGMQFYRHFIGGIEVPPRHRRGHVVLLVQQGLRQNLLALLNEFQAALVGDGWSTAILDAPAHVPPTDPSYAQRRGAVVSLINGNIRSGQPNVIFILGRVVIPYSGTVAFDGHGLANGNHRGAWTCDAYYGYQSKTGWDDNATLNDTLGFASPNDQRFDRDFLQQAPDWAVGRVDFTDLPALGATPEALIARYLRKDLRYRRGEIPTFGRVSVFPGNDWNIQAIQNGQSFAGAAFGTGPGRVFNGLNLRQWIPSDLGIHFRSGNDAWVNDGIPAPDSPATGFEGTFNADQFAQAQQEVPVVFRNVLFSFACDWARISGTGIVPNNWLRASLAWPNYGLAVVGGPMWDFSPLGGGMPLSDLMTRGWADFFAGTIPRFQSILGDPTLCLFRVKPVPSVTATGVPAVGASGLSAVNLTWTPSPEPGCRYFVYRSNSGITGDFTVLNPNSATSDLRFTDNTPQPNPQNVLYMVRAVRLQVSGSGSFWNLSQGVFAKP